MKSLVVGIGSTILTDDGVGVYAARAVADALSGEHLDVLELGTAGIALLDYVAGYQRLILLDAMVTGVPAGTVHQLTGEEFTVSAHLGSAHEADLPTVLALGRRLYPEQMPDKVIVIGIEAQELTEFNESLTPAVAAAIPRVVTLVESILAGE